MNHKRMALFVSEFCHKWEPLYGVKEGSGEGDRCL